MAEHILKYVLFSIIVLKRGCGKNYIAPQCSLQIIFSMLYRLMPYLPRYQPRGDVHLLSGVDNLLSWETELFRFLT